ncbi:MAG: hypothetical protein ACT4P1_16380, partial [Sporichthyaceae bacterium]
MDSGVDMEQHDFEVRLEGTGEERGALRLDAVSEICRRLQELSRRVARHVAGGPEVGRTAEHPAAVGRLVLRGIRTGNTALVIGYGEPEVLPIDVGQEMETAQRFWEILTGMQDGIRPHWASPLVATTAGRLLEATVRAAESVAIRRQDGAEVAWTRRDADREPWLPVPDQVTSETVT